VSAYYSSFISVAYLVYYYDGGDWRIKVKPRLHHAGNMLPGIVLVNSLLSECLTTRIRHS